MSPNDDAEMARIVREDGLETEKCKLALVKILDLEKSYADSNEPELFWCAMGIAREALKP